jgi:hypothetical protein
MKILIVVDEPENCAAVLHDFLHAQAEDIRVLAARDYLADPVWAHWQFQHKLPPHQGAQPVRLLSLPESGLLCFPAG